jgi:hypothetical protein
MVWTANWDGAYLVGGDSNLRLTPNFRLREFRRADGSLRVHRELVSALQLLRNRFGRPVSIRAIDEDGLGALIRGASPAELLQAADALEDHHLFAEATRDGDAVRVRIPDPDALPEIGLEQALETAFSVTSSFETSGDRFQQVTGNFDGAGLSFGPAQVNFGSRTLVPLFREFQNADEAALRACFPNSDDYEEWLWVLDLVVEQQIAWADSISTGRGKHDVVEPWKGYLQAVGRTDTFRAIMVETALRKYGARLLRSLEYLQTLVPFQIDHLRCVCSLYDLVIQQGSLDKAHAEIENRVHHENPQDQFDLVRIAVEERGRKASSRWRADCISRRRGILEGTPVTVSEKGNQSQRANIAFYMLRDVRIRGARELMTADVGEELKRVSRAGASGGTLLA